MRLTINMPDWAIIEIEGLQIVFGLENGGWKDVLCPSIDFRAGTVEEKQQNDVCQTHRARNNLVRPNNIK